MQARELIPCTANLLKAEEQKKNEWGSQTSANKTPYMFNRCVPAETLKELKLR